MKIGILTSSRADYSIYLPLIRALNNDSNFKIGLIVFGTHLSHNHGYTIQNIQNDGFEIDFCIETMPQNDSPKDISECIGTTITSFSNIWEKSEYDLVFCLGDRFEMFAACASSVPFNIKLAHIHGGEQTLGAIDDAFRHCITNMSIYHFTVTEQYKNRVIEIKGSDKNVYNVGSLSFDNLKNISFYSIDEFYKRFGIDMNIPSILITFHPETVSYHKNEDYIKELIFALEEINEYQLIITMPNADTMGNLIRNELEKFASNANNVKLVESFGTIGYLSCMKHCKFMLGNTSSGFAEAAYFPKFVINLGNRQEGRLLTKNILNCSIEKHNILNAVNKFKTFTDVDLENIYGDGNTANAIINILKKDSINAI